MQRGVSPDSAKNVSEIKNCAIHLLARREHSCFELRNKLKLRDFDSASIEIVLQELSAANLQSDVRFTEAYIRMRANKGYGPLRIYAELRERGIDEELLSQFLDDADSLWQDKVIEVFRKKFSGKVAKDFSERAKQARFLQYRGFSHGQIKQVLREL